MGYTDKMINPYKVLLAECLDKCYTYVLEKKCTIEEVFTVILYNVNTYTNMLIKENYEYDTLMFLRIKFLQKVGKELKILETKL